jgi:hypothetical protein
MAKYVPSPRDWVREQVDLYESSGGTEGTTLRDTGLPVIIVTHLRVNPDVEIRDETVVRPMRVREVKDEAERSRLWQLAIAAYPPYAEYQERTARRIPVFVAESC